MKIKKRLNEDTLANAVNQAANEMENEPEIIIDKAEYKGDIEKALDKCLATSRRAILTGDSEGFLNALLIGQAGTGKTSRVKEWARKNNITLFEVDAKTLDPTDMGGIVARDDANKRRSIKLSSSEFDPLDRPNSVLFLDEYNRAASDVRGTLLELINNHVVNDNEEPSGKRFLPNLLFTVIAINPANGSYNTDELDVAELSRFKQVPVAMDPISLLSHLESVFTKNMEKLADYPEEVKAERGRLEIAKTLLNDRSFEFDNMDDEAEAVRYGTPILNPRSLTNLLKASDGTKEDFLSEWNSICNPSKKGMAERILANYQDVDDKANDALKKYGNAFKEREQTAWDKINDKLNS